MKAAVFGSGLMGTAIAFDILQNTSIDSLVLIDANEVMLKKAKKVLHNLEYDTVCFDLKNEKKTADICSNVDISISAVPYFFNEMLTKIAIENGSHFIDLGGNNDVVAQQKMMHGKAKENKVTIIPDSGLAPGLVSIITKDIVDTYENIEFVQLRVGGLPVHPKPPLEYELVFSPNGLINEYLEDAIVLDHGKIVQKKSMAEVETIEFPEPFGKMEAFITSGGCSSLPATYKDTIQYLDYKTIRYPGHCTKFKTLLDLGFGSTKAVSIDNKMITPRSVLIQMLETYLPRSGQDVVLLKVLSRCKKQNQHVDITYEMIDYFDDKTGFTAMMRTTGFPVSITADLLAKGIIKRSGVFCPEEIVPPKNMIEELKKRDVMIHKKETPLV